MERDLIPSAIGQLITTNPNWLVEKENEVKRGEEALEALKYIPGISKTKITRVRQRIAFLRRYIVLLKEGFIPIPRMDYRQIETTVGSKYGYYSRPHMFLDRMPIEALKNIAEFKHKFDEIGLVRPIARKRDPILIGIIRSSRQEEHFILYFWRPELYNDSQLW